MMFKRLFLLITLFFMLAGYTSAQDTPQVYVTTQDYAALRAGPGQNWDKLAVLSYGQTYRATGRTLDGRWLQIAYEGELTPGARTEFTVDGVTYGWVAYWLLVWSGDILQLPLDGVKLVPTAREAGPTIIIGPESPYLYDRWVDPSTHIPSPIDRIVQVEVTGRIGSPDSGYFLLQFKVNNQYYWTATWAYGVPSGWQSLPDGGYLFPYSRLLIELRSEATRASNVLSDIGGRWRALDAGQATTCNDIPDDFKLRESSFSPADLNREPVYRPTAEALVNTQTSINAALARFRQVCSQPNRQVAPEDVRAALDDVQTAQRNLAIVQTLLAPLQHADPLFAGNQQTDSTQNNGSP